MSTFPWLTVIGAVPLVGALAIAPAPGCLRAGQRGRPGGPAAAGQAAGPGVQPDHAGPDDRHDGGLQARRRGVPVHPDLPVDPAVRRALRGRRGRHRAGADRDDRGADAGGRAGLVERRRPGGAAGRRRGAGPGRHRAGQHGAPAAARGEDLLRAAAGAGDDDDRRLRGHRRVPVLRVLRGHADPDVLPDRQLRGRPAAVRGGQVPAVQPVRRAAHAGRGHRAVRVLGARRASRHVPVQPAGARHVHARPRRSGCSSGSSSRSPSRRRCGRSTPGCRTRLPPPSRVPRCCWSA